MQLSVVMPTLDERENVQALIPRLGAALREAESESEIWVVDDDSSDRTWEAAEALRAAWPELRVLRRIHRHGLASAWLDGCRASRGAFIALMDADLAHSPVDLLRLYRRCRESGGALVIGSRYKAGAGGMPGKPLVSRLASVMAQMLARLLLGIRGTDLTHSFRVFGRELFEQIEPELSSQGNAFLVEFTFRARQAGYPVVEVPVSYGRRVHGRTKLSLLREGFRFLVTLVRLRWRTRS